MEPYYPAGYTQEEIAEMFGIKVNDSHPTSDAPTTGKAVVAYR